MPYTCCVPKCRGNYKGGPKVATFCFPKEDDLRKKWINAINRLNFLPTSNTRVCELHFQQDELERVTKFYNEKTGTLLTAPLARPRLVKGVVPNQFPNWPSYMLKQKVQHREEPEQKRLRLECEMIENAIKVSIETEKCYNDRKTFTSINELRSKLEDIELGNWVTSSKNNSVYFFYVDDHTLKPIIKCFICISEDLTLSVFAGDIEITSLPGSKLKFPMVVNNVNIIEEVLGLIAQSALIEKRADKSVKQTINLITEALESLLPKLLEHKSSIKFLLDQVKLLSTSCKTRLRYSCETTLFCGLLHSISPHAYKFIRHSGNLILPSPSTVKRICNNFTTDPRLEQNESGFLHYAASKFKLLNPKDKTVVLMVDEIHIKPYMDYKGGNIVGGAFNSAECATSAHVFMINSVLSTYKDVVHIIPVKTLTADMLHNFIKKIILGLENIGFEVLAVVTDNNSINRKAMSFFSEPPVLFSNTYCHPKDASRPLFYLVDTVHLMKNIKNNWLNQKPYQYMMYPDFKEEVMRLASFEALKQMHSLEKDKLLKYGYSLSLKALFPTSIERQNVKLTLQVFNRNMVTALRELGPKKSLESYEDTANYIELICTWWDIVNVKTLLKGKRLRNSFQEPITKSSEHLSFLTNFLNWLSRWEKCQSGGKLTTETRKALYQSTDALIKMANYCLDTKNFNFFLCGQVQTDKLEERFGKYRQQAGAQYHISIRQVFESESKLRMQSVVPLILKSLSDGDVKITLEDISSFREEPEDDSTFKTCVFEKIPILIKDACIIDDDEIDCIDDNTWPLIVYISGYASYSAVKKLQCDYCKTVLKETSEFVNFSTFISANDRGGLSYPSESVVTLVAYNYLIVKKLLLIEHDFLIENNHRDISKTLTFETIKDLDLDLFLGFNCKRHSKSDVINKILHPTTNILLNNFIKKRNDVVKTKTMPQCKRVKPNKKN